MLVLPSLRLQKVRIPLQSFQNCLRSLYISLFPVPHSSLCKALPSCVPVILQEVPSLQVSCVLYQVNRHQSRPLCHPLPDLLGSLCSPSITFPFPSSIPRQLPLRRDRVCLRCMLRLPLHYLFLLLSYRHEALGLQLVSL